MPSKPVPSNSKGTVVKPLSFSGVNCTSLSTGLPSTVTGSPRCPVHQDAVQGVAFAGDEPRVEHLVLDAGAGVCRDLVVAVGRVSCDGADLGLGSTFTVCPSS